MEKIKTLLIEDSGLMRIMISDSLRSDPEIEVIGTANNGWEGVRKVRALHPDVVVTDMIMPEYDGLYAVKNIMKDSPTPIILLSSLDRANPEIFDALNAGAFDFVDKPQTKDADDFKGALGTLKQRIRAAVALNSDVLGKVVDKTNHHFHSFDGVLQYEVLTIGASTGGPSAIESILAQLPSNLAIPVVIVQHMPKRFLTSYTERLSSILPLKVKLATHCEELTPGTIYIAPGDGNMMVKANRHGNPHFQYTKKEYKEFNHPSIDCMFESIASLYGAKAIGVILTGMGKDGSQGLLQIKKKGGLTVAQEGKSCVVNGMPQASVDIGAAGHVMKLGVIPGFIVSCF
ncbi:chemotaxis-specific protein-glutamate methyltransferase CheB [Fulvivirgaceae bacterium BMA12]|uniref:Protein-glutamate methylesterase/protein-glutamine glutaminase n=1 Tax=Agaribacillus aureus TaxID=3051825 RepID=A0ABT8L8H3_9BACT|nr:chemotaxis-specific protein-glutamate methyltransferase CheB [Fulvivirgaceae bacterium BMA12]